MLEFAEVPSGSGSAGICLDIAVIQIESLGAVSLGVLESAEFEGGHGSVGEGHGRGREGDAGGIAVDGFFELVLLEEFISLGSGEWRERKHIILMPMRGGKGWRRRKD